MSRRRARDSTVVLSVILVVLGVAAIVRTAVGWAAGSG